MGSDVIYNKIAIIERCIYRIREEYNNNPDSLKNLASHKIVGMLSKF
jgi:hypothetical protein